MCHHWVQVHLLFPSLLPSLSPFSSLPPSSHGFCPHCRFATSFLCQFSARLLQSWNKLWSVLPGYKRNLSCSPTPLCHAPFLIQCWLQPMFWSFYSSAFLYCLWSWSQKLAHWVIWSSLQGGGCFGVERLGSKVTGAAVCLACLFRVCSATFLACTYVFLHSQKPGLLFSLSLCPAFLLKWSWPPFPTPLLTPISHLLVPSINFVLVGFQARLGWSWINEILHLDSWSSNQNKFE